MRAKTSPPAKKRPEKTGFQGSGRGRLVAGALTLVAHILLLTALFWPRTPPRPHFEPTPPPITVSLLETPKPLPPAPPEPEEQPVPAPSITVKPVPPVAPVEAIAAPARPDNSDLLSGSQIAGATAVGEGSGGGGACDLGHAVQQALRRDSTVRAAVEEAHRTGKAFMIWNGDWVRTGDQDGKGLSAVREAITWEVAFAPEACRNMRQHGLVLLSLADGGTRFALGSEDWRWSDLLGLRRAQLDR